MPDNLVQRLADLLTQRDIDLLRLAASDEIRFSGAINNFSEELARRLLRLDHIRIEPLALKKDFLIYDYH